MMALAITLLISLPVLAVMAVESEHTPHAPHIPWRPIQFTPIESAVEDKWRHRPGVTQEWSAKGMDHLYLMTEMLISAVQPAGLPSPLISDQLFSQFSTLESSVESVVENRQTLLSHFWRLVLLASICTLSALTVALIGMCWCGCWMSSLCAKKSRHSKRKYSVESSCDPCCRPLLATILLALLLLMTFFVICAFVTNEYIDNGVHQLPTSVNRSADDIILYLNNTQSEVNTLLRANYAQLERELADSLDRSGLIVKNRLALLSHASALDNLTDIVTKLESILIELEVLSNETGELRLLTFQLREKLWRSKNDLELFFRDCKNQICSELRLRYQNILSSFSVSTRIDHLPDLSPLMQNITTLLKANIVREIIKGKKAFDELSEKIQSTVNNAIPDINAQIRTVGKELAAIADDINQALRTPFDDLYTIKANTKIAQNYVNQYEIYRWYAFIAVTALVSTILVLYSFGLICGVCNEQPTRHSYRRRPQSCSRRFFSCGIVMTFLFFTPLLLFTTALFIFGTFSDRVMCYYMENPSHTQSRQVMSILQNNFHRLGYSHSLNVIRGVKPNFADVLWRCHQNLSLYNVLQLSRFNQIQINNQRIIDVNITDILTFKNRYRIEEKLSAFLDRVDVNPSRIVILTSEGYNLLDSLKRTSLGTLNFSSYADVIKYSITPLDLLSISTELEREASRLPSNEVQNVAKLRNIAMDLRAQMDLVLKIKNAITKLTEGALKIEANSNYGNQKFADALTHLLSQAVDAQKFIAKNGSLEIRNVAKAFVSDLSSLIDQYAQHVIEEIESGIGKCEPVSRAVNASVNAFCRQTVLPLNGYSYSLMSALNLCLLSTLFACILCRLYQKVKSFRTRRESIDSTLDNLDEDDIPLAHVDSKNNLNAYESGASPSAPIAVRDDNWSPGAPLPHLYVSRPPPYNFHN